MVWGWFRRRPVITLDVPEADFYLREPMLQDYPSWREARARNYEHLQPFEPRWADDALEEHTFRNIVRAAQHNGTRGTGYSFFLLTREGHHVIGAINITNIRRRVAQSATIGYWICAGYGRAGRMKKTVSRTVDFCFDELGLHRVEAACIPENGASAAILLGCGFEEEGYAKGYLKINGEWYDHRLFGLIRPDHLPQI